MVGFGIVSDTDACLDMCAGITGVIGGHMILLTGSVP